MYDKNDIFGFKINTKLDEFEKSPAIKKLRELQNSPFGKLQKQMQNSPLNKISSKLNEVITPPKKEPIYFETEEDRQIRKVKRELNLTSLDKVKTHYSNSIDYYVGELLKPYEPRVLKTAAPYKVAVLEHFGYFDTEANKNETALYLAKKLSAILPISIDGTKRLISAIKSKKVDDKNDKHKRKNFVQYRHWLKELGKETL